MNRKIFSLFSVVILSVCLILASCKSSKQVELIEGSVPFTSAVKTGVLENGFTYYVMSNKEPKNRIVIKLVVNAGACNEDEDQRRAFSTDSIIWSGVLAPAVIPIVERWKKFSGMSFTDCMCAAFLQLAAAVW